MSKKIVFKQGSELVKAVVIEGAGFEHGNKVEFTYLYDWNYQEDRKATNEELLNSEEQENEDYKIVLANIYPNVNNEDFYIKEVENYNEDLTIYYLKNLVENIKDALTTKENLIAIAIEVEE